MLNSSEVKGSALTKQREQDSSMGQHSAGGASGLLSSQAPGSQCQGWFTSVEEKKCRGQSVTLMLWFLCSWLLVCSGLHSVPRQEKTTQRGSVSKQLTDQCEPGLDESGNKKMVL